MLEGLALEEDPDHRHKFAGLCVTLHWNFDDCTILPNCGECSSVFIAHLRLSLCSMCATILETELAGDEIVYECIIAMKL